MPLPSTWLVGAGPGDPSLLTVRAAELLAGAEVVLCESGLPAELFEPCRGSPIPVDVATLLREARGNQRVVSLMFGDPRASSLGLEQARALRDAGIPFGVVPGLPENYRGSGYDGSLVGKRLLVPRAPEQSLRSAREIRTRGAEAVVLPLIALTAPSDTRLLESSVSRLSSYDWVLLTSANGSRRLCAALRRAGLDARAFGHARIGAIGPETAAPLTELGLRPDLVSSAHVAEEFARELLLQPTFRRALLVRAEQARDVLPETLRASGVELDVVPAYRTESLADSQRAPLRQLLATKQLDAILVTSSSMARALAEALGDEGRALLEGVVVASIGPITSQTLTECGMAPSVEANVYTMEGLLDAVEGWFEGGGRRG
jgi:uroporphyrinogen III methyltransferase / synthase